MKRTPISKLLTIILGFNVFQLIIILLNQGEPVDLPFLIFVSIPLFFASYFAMKFDRIAYVLLLYWYTIQILGFDLPGSSFGVSYGFTFHFRFFDGAFTFNPIAVFLTVLVLLEVDRVFLVPRDQSPTATQVAGIRHAPQQFRDAKQPSGTA